MRYVPFSWTQARVTELKSYELPRIKVSPGDELVVSVNGTNRYVETCRDKVFFPPEFFLVMALPEGSRLHSMYEAMECDFLEKAFPGVPHQELCLSHRGWTLSANRVYSCLVSAVQYKLKS